MSNSFTVKMPVLIRLKRRNSYYSLPLFAIRNRNGDVQRFNMVIYWHRNRFVMRYLITVESVQHHDKSEMASKPTATRASRRERERERLKRREKK